MRSMIPGRRTAVCLLTMIALLLPARAWPLAGQPDPTFDGDGALVSPGAPTLQADDKMLLVIDNKLVRLATDGSLDPTFDGDGMVDAPPGFLMLGPDGPVGTHIYAVLYQAMPPLYAIARYDLSGTLDGSYGVAGIQNLVPGAAGGIRDSIGRFVGYSFTYDSVAQDFTLYVHRYNPDGTPDLGFGTAGTATVPPLTGEKASDFAYGVLVQPDDKIVLLAGSSWDEGGAIDPEDEAEVEESDEADYEDGGDFVKGGSSLALLRFNTDGSLDTSFSGNGKGIFAAQDAYSQGILLHRMADGRLVVVATVLENVPGDHDLNVLNFARFNADGSPDTTLGGNGITRSEFPYLGDFGDAVVAPNGKILVSTSVVIGTLPCNPGFNDTRPGIVRFNLDGTVDTTYGRDGVAVVNESQYATYGSLIVDSLGRAVVTTTTADDPCTTAIEGGAPIIARLLPDCTLDGVVQPGESCDDGDLDSGDGCDNTCEVQECWSCTGTAPSVCSPESAGTACNDGNVCTAGDQCDGSGGCTDLTPTPRVSCIVAEQSSLTIGRGTTPLKDKLSWSWKDEVDSVYDFRDPAVGGTGHTLCIFDGAGALMQAELPPGGYCNGDRCWKTNVYKDYYKFKDKTLANGGIEQMLLDEDGAIKLKGKGVNLPDSPVLVDPVTVQLIQHGGPNQYCFESVYTGSDFAKSTVKGFKGKHKE